MTKGDVYYDPTTDWIYVYSYSRMGAKRFEWFGFVNGTIVMIQLDDELKDLIKIGRL